MSNSKAPSPIRAADYEAIEAALLDSARGRWFLAEYTRRNRSADTRMLLDAISRLEANMLRQRGARETPNIHGDLIEMAEAISRTRKEIASMCPADQQDSRFTTATEELDAIVEATEKATSDILEAAEDMQEIAWQMRENGADGAACDQLDARATDIYTACSFQDLTGQRTSRVVQTLHYLEKRVTAMIGIWGLEDIEVRERICHDKPDEARFLNGPARNGEGMEQAGVDRMIDARDDVPPAADDETGRGPEQPAPVREAPRGRDVPEEIEARDFTAPPELKLDQLSETGKQVLFS